MPINCMCSRSTQTALLYFGEFQTNRIIRLLVCETGSIIERARIFWGDLYKIVCFILVTENPPHTHVVPMHRIHQITKWKDYVYGIWVYKALGIWKGCYRVKNHWFHTCNREQREEMINMWNITPNLHTNSHFEMWAEKWTIMQEASGSSV